MSGVWIKLHDTRVRVDRFQRDFWSVARALDNLYNVPTLADFDESDWPETESWSA